MCLFFWCAMSEDAPKPPPETDLLKPGGEFDNIKASDVRKDLKLIRRAKRAGWPIPDGTLKIVMDRMLGLVTAKSVPVPMPDGKIVDRIDIANRQATEAARIIQEADKSNQTDFWNEDKKDQTDYWGQLGGVGKKNATLN